MALFSLKNVKPLYDPTIANISESGKQGCCTMPLKGL